MSKSKGNGTEPITVIEEYGVDATRFFLVSVAAPDKGFNWSEKGISGSLRFIRKIFNTFSEIKEGRSSEELEKKLNQTIKNVSHYYPDFDYRKATIELKELFDILATQSEASKEDLEKALKLLNPICPHITEELWEKIGNKGFISKSEWPRYKEEKKKEIKQDLSEKIISKVKPVTDKFLDKKKVFLYVLPFEKDKLDEAKLSKKLNREVKVFSVKEEDKHDPENKSKKARPGSPGIYLE